jgi:hypothetical protein
MTAGEMQTRVLERLDQMGGVEGYYSAPEALSAINEGIRFFTLLTLGLEAQASFTVTAGAAFYHAQDQLADWLLPLRVRVTGGGFLRPARLDDLDALNTAWQATAGTPNRYAALGFDFLAVTPQANATLDITYARAPVPLAASTDVPEYPEDTHGAFTDYAVNRLRFREGGQEFGKTLPYLRRFMDEAARYGNYVRARSVAGRYDKLPPEIERMDLSKLLTLRKDLVPLRRKDG